MNLIYSLKDNKRICNCGSFNKHLPKNSNPLSVMYKFLKELKNLKNSNFDFTNFSKF